MNLRMTIPTRWLAITLVSLGLSACSNGDREAKPRLGGDSTSTGKFVLEPVEPLPEKVDMTKTLA